MARDSHRDAHRTADVLMVRSMNTYPQCSSTGVCKIRNTVLTSTYIESLDLILYAEAYKSRGIMMIPKENDSYSCNVVRRKERNKKRILIIVALIVAAMIGVSPAHGVSQVDLLKLYAHSRIISMEQFKCFDSLITRESHWNVRAKNGSHYGLGQMKNARYRTLDGFTQVDWSIRYIRGRYLTPCKAWSFFKANGYH